jgi:hypothetical protein
MKSFNIIIELIKKKFKISKKILYQEVSKREKYIEQTIIVLNTIQTKLIVSTY